uniref:SSD domain-containing protein n=1 Tax=Rhabditophanes sp. KR3021 TaxID=114890 RepID=A0AC35U5L1_9BILA
MLGTGMDLSPNFFGLKLNNTEDPFRVTNIDDLKLVILQFRADPSENMNRDDVLAWERTVGHYFNNKFKGQFVETKTLSITFIGDEIVRTGMTLFPFISVGFVIMSIFSIVTVYMSAYYFDQWTKHKISMALMAGVCPLLATSTALGFLFWCGFRFGSILCVTPFLVMAIGVDDAYLMIHSWQRICVKRQAEKKKHIQEHDSNYYSLAERIAEVTVDVGPSITITSLTNVLAFGVGTFAPTPEIQLFCYANVVAIFIDYIYQMTMFLAIIAIAGDYEIAMEKDRPTKTGEVNVNLKRRAMSFMKAYCKWLSNPFTSLIIIFVMAFYLTWSIQATMSIGVKLTPDKLFLHDSTILKINRLRDNYVVPNYLAISLFVNNASNLEDPAKEKRLEQMINEFETMDESLGFKYSKYWKRDYEGFVNILSEDPEMSFENEISKDSKAVSVNSLYSRKSIHQFVNWPEYKHWGGFIRFDNHTDTISKFFISLAYKSEGFKSWNFRGVMLSKWRAITKKYPELDATIYYEDASFLDQIDTLIPATVSSSIWTLICMAIVCIFFMKNVFTVVVASLAITSICVGVFGCLAAWGIDLDPISMATTIMSIGFSVDFPAHISYHYYRCGVETGFKLSIEHRILDALIAIGFPLLQCAISTILFVTCLLFIDTYMSEVFVKTMVLVVSLGLVHALIVVPSFLCMLSNLNMAVFGNENKDEVSVIN